jgi:acyl dehydratase
LLVVVERDELSLVKKIGVPGFRKISLGLVVEMASVLGDLHTIHVDFAFASQDLGVRTGMGTYGGSLRLKVLRTYIHRRWVIPSNFWLVCSLSFVLKQCI